MVDGARHLLSYNHRRVDKTITAGPSADPAEGGLQVVAHGPDDAAGSLVGVVQGWIDDGVAPADIAVLARVNSLLLAPQIALAEADVPIHSVLRPEVLERTGMRAALAYLRLAAAGAGRLDTRDIVEVLRRPTRGLPQWFPDRLERRGTWSVSGVRGISDQVPDKEAAKVLRLAEDLQLVVDAAQGGTTRDVLEVVRDDVGLGSAMGLLDRTGGGQGSSHLDDLEGLLAVADLHPDPAGFEGWLRERFGREQAPDGVTLSTVHRVKGREWNRVVVFGVQAGITPHRLSDDVEEERRVLHVGITRGRERVAVLADRTRPSPFVEQLAGTAPHRPATSTATPARVDAGRPSSKGRAAPTASDAVAAAEGLVMRVLGGYEGKVEDADARSVALRLDGGRLLTVRYGERVEIDGRKAPLAPPTDLWGPAAEAEAILRAWRTEESRSQGKPAYVVLSDAHLRGIALARPDNAKDLLACDGIGPTKLERYGDEILARLDQVGGV